MTIKKIIIPSYFHFKSLILLLSIFILQVNAETTIVAEDGETLFSLSKKYGVSLKELMHKNNFNDAAKIIEGKTIVIPPGKVNNNNNNNNNLTYKVIEGDTIYGIARKYQIKPIDIISLNKLKDSSYLKPKQIILLPKEAVYKKELSQKKFQIANKKVFYHQTSKDETLSEIARIHNISKEEIIALNKINNPKKINSNFKLKIRDSLSDKWINYGPLKVNWSEWRYLDGNYITKVKTKKNKAFFIGISCENRSLNNTLEDSYWTNWYFPEYDFEYKLINDFCDYNFNS